MLDLLFRKFDIDKDGVISYDEYASVVKSQPMLMEFLGKCLPESTALSVVEYCSNIISKINDEQKMC